jgi:hypothetical protein
LALELVLDGLSPSNWLPSDIIFLGFSPFAQTPRTCVFLFLFSAVTLSEFSCLNPWRLNLTVITYGWSALLLSDLYPILLPPTRKRRQLWEPSSARTVELFCPHTLNLRSLSLEMLVTLLSTVPTTEPTLLLLPGSLWHHPSPALPP